MYYIEPLVNFCDSTYEPASMYHVAPLICVKNKSYINGFIAKQDSILAKLNVLRHNLNAAQCKPDINYPALPNDIDELLKIQENVLSRLRHISTRVANLSQDLRVVSDKLLNLAQLEILQDNVYQRINALKTLFSKMHSKKLTNISIFADCSKPPLSVILLLTLLKKHGYKVACLTFCKKVEHSKVSLAVLEYIKSNLSLDHRRCSYDIIVTIIWQKLDVKDCISHDNIFKNYFMIGEMVLICYLSKILSIDIASVMNKIETINDNLLYQQQSKNVTKILNQMLTNNVNINCKENIFLSSFLISSLVQAGMYSKFEGMLKSNFTDALLNCTDVCKLINDLN